MTDTREDKLVQEICEKYFPTDQGGYSIKLHKNWIEDAIREAIRLTREEKWIPVSERLPEDPMVSVLFYVPSNDEMLDTRWLTGWWHAPSNCWMSGLDEYAPNQVTHWQPLPTPPEGSSK